MAAAGRARGGAGMLHSTGPAGSFAGPRKPLAGLKMPFSIATWNINSVRLRMPLVERFLLEHQPDVLCL